MWIDRELAQSWDTFGNAPIRIVRGVRQCGKSALIQHLGRSRTVLDDLSVRETAQSDPALFLDLQPAPLAIDEVQYAPALFPEIKRRIDRMRDAQRNAAAYDKNKYWPSDGMYWLTGSNQILMRKNVQESLAGRATNLTLHPLSMSEIMRSKPATKIGDLIIRGGWPELHVHPETDPVTYLNDYIQAVLEKDVTQSAGIQKISSFSRVLRLSAARVGSLLQMSDISRDAGVQVSTVGDWLGFLQEMLFVTLLEPYHSNLNKRLIKTPKFYFNDTGLASRLQGWRDPEPAMLSPQSGGLFENLVWTEILRARDHSNAAWDLNFWRTKEGYEVDFLIHTAERCVAIEAKFSTQNIPHDLDFEPLERVFEDRLHCVVVVAGGVRKQHPAKSPKLIDVVPVAELGHFLRTIMKR